MTSYEPEQAAYDEWIAGKHLEAEHEQKVRTRWFHEYCQLRVDGETHEDAISEFPEYGDEFKAQYEAITKSYQQARAA